MTPPLWMIRAGGRAARAGTFQAEGIVALGVGREFGELPEYGDPDELFEQIRQLHPSWRPGRHRAAAAQLHCFLREIEPGDRVITWDPRDRSFLVGTISSEARWDPDGPEDMPFVRQVSWTHRLPQEALSNDTRAALNVIQTLFHVGPSFATEVHARAVPIGAALPARSPAAPTQAAPAPAGPPGIVMPSPWMPPPGDGHTLSLDVEHTPLPGTLKKVARPTSVVVEEEDPDLEPGQEDIYDALDPEEFEVEEEDAPVGQLAPPRPVPPQLGDTDPPEPPPPPARPATPGSSLAVAARQRVESRIASLPLDGLRSVVAGVLQARGYPRRSVDSETGADLFSGADLLGREEPPVRVQVLQGDGVASAEEVKAVLADRPADERWILVCAEGFDRRARALTEAPVEKAPRATLVDGADLAALLLRHYEDLDAPTRSLVPLVRAWWPAWEETP